ncbi:hypothetical protein T484DRAFT_2447932 [Baffinella frigidus]|nr:hypothetical protein T484DRAFT_2447932 [Cryptophyta sp. CCMP2293]
MQAIDQPHRRRRPSSAGERRIPPAPPPADEASARTSTRTSGFMPLLGSRRSSPVMTRRTQSLDSAPSNEPHSGWGSIESFFGSLVTRFDGAVVRARNFTMLSAKTSPRSATWSTSAFTPEPRETISRSYTAPSLRSAKFSVPPSSRDQISNGNTSRRLLPPPARAVSVTSDHSPMLLVRNQDDTTVAMKAAFLSLRRVGSSVSQVEDEPQPTRDREADGNRRGLPRDRGAIIALSRELSRRRMEAPQHR